MLENHQQASSLLHLKDDKAQPAKVASSVVLIDLDLFGGEENAEQFKHLDMEKIRKISGEMLGLAGLDSIWNNIRDAIFLPSLYPPEYQESMQAKTPKGCILVGEPGNGKTQLVRCLATLVYLCYGTVPVVVELQHLASSMVGDPEKYIASLFADAKQDWEKYVKGNAPKPKPLIMYFDELDAIAGVRTAGRGGDLVPADNKKISALLVELDGLNSAGHVIVIGTTNRLDRIDPALRRSGRFGTKLYYVPRPNLLARIEILKLKLKHQAQHVQLSDQDFMRLGQETMFFSGADLTLVVDEAKHNTTIENLPLLSQIAKSQGTVDSSVFAFAEQEIMERHTTMTRLMVSVKTSYVQDLIEYALHMVNNKQQQQQQDSRQAAISNAVRRNRLFVHDYRRCAKRFYQPLISTKGRPLGHFPLHTPSRLLYRQNTPSTSSSPSSTNNRISDWMTEQQMASVSFSTYLKTLGIDTIKSMYDATARFVSKSNAHFFEQTHPLMHNAWEGQFKQASQIFVRGELHMSRNAAQRCQEMRDTLQAIFRLQPFFVQTQDNGILPNPLRPCLFESVIELAKRMDAEHKRANPSTNPYACIKLTLRHMLQAVRTIKNNKYQQSNHFFISPKQYEYFASAKPLCQSHREVWNGVHQWLDQHSRKRTQMPFSACSIRSMSRRSGLTTMVRSILQQQIHMFSFQAFLSLASILSTSSTSSSSSFMSTLMAQQTMDETNTDVDEETATLMEGNNNGGIGAEQDFLAELKQTTTASDPQCIQILEMIHACEMETDAGAAILVIDDAQQLTHAAQALLGRWLTGDRYKPGGQRFLLNHPFVVVLLFSSSAQKNTSRFCERRSSKRQVVLQVNLDLEDKVDYEEAAQNLQGSNPVLHDFSHEKHIAALPSTKKSVGDFLEHMEAIFEAEASAEQLQWTAENPQLANKKFFY